MLAEGGYDWTAIRAERLLNNDRDIYFEYEIETDMLQLHRRRGDKQVDRREERFIGNLDARADWMVFHDSIKDVKELFRNAAQGLPGEAEIRYRKDAMQSAGFQREKTPPKARRLHPPSYCQRRHCERQREGVSQLAAAGLSAAQNAQGQL